MSPHRTPDFSDEESDDGYACHAGSDLETDRLDAIQRLRKANKKIPRKLRTHNLLLTNDFCEHWGRAEGIRELVQNFLDGICTAFDITMHSVKFQHKVNGGERKSRWTEAWIAVDKNTESKEFGRITHNRKTGALIITNENVTLSERVLLYGKSNKRRRRYLIGGFGEGMKIGILRLIVEGSGVRYRTGGQIWKFFMKQPRGVEDETLHYRTTNSKAVQRGNLEVTITNIDDDDFVLDNFLPLSRHLQSPIHEFALTPGHLIESCSRPDLASKRIYVKGLLVNSNLNLRVSVNFTDAEVSRDRNIKMVDEDMKKNLASIWAYAFERERHKAMDEKKFTKKFLSFTKKDTSSVEFQCMDYMDCASAQSLYHLILETTPEAFPYKQGADEEAKLIFSSLKKTPYPVHEHFLKLLMKNPKITTVYEAQEKAFLSDSAASPDAVYELPLAHMVMAYTVKMVGQDKITVKFHKPATTGLDALLKDDVLICSEDLIQVDYEEEEQSVAAKLDVIACVEREPQKGKDEAEARRISFQTMRFIASAEFRSYLCPSSRSLTHSPVTPDAPEEREDDNQRNFEDSSESHLRVGSKRLLHGVENSGSAYENPEVTIGAPRPRTKRTKVTATDGQVFSTPKASGRRAVTVRKTAPMLSNNADNAGKEDPMEISEHTPNTPVAQATSDGRQTAPVTPAGQNHNEEERYIVPRSNEMVNNLAQEDPEGTVQQDTPTTFVARTTTTPGQIPEATHPVQDQNREGDAAAKVTRNEEETDAQRATTTPAIQGTLARREATNTQRVQVQNGEHLDAEQVNPSAQSLQRERVPSLPHRMRFILGGSTLDLTHKLSSITEFSVVQTFAYADGGRDQVTTMNLGTVFPACRTKDGDVTVSVCVQQNTQESDLIPRGQHHSGERSDMDRVNPPEGTEAQNTTALAHHMRFVTGVYNFDLVHKLSLRTEFSMVQTTYADAAGGQVTKMNLGATFPSCRTKDGDIFVSVRVRKNFTR